MKKTTIKFRVRYGETDQMGVVYYGNYAQYLEQGRTEWLRDLGFSYRWMEEHDVQLPVVRLEIDYKRPARYDDLIKVTTTLRNIPTHKITGEPYVSASKNLNTLESIVLSISTYQKDEF